MSEPSEIYTAQWYADVRAGLGHEYVQLADIIDETFAPYETVIDVGCGAGLVLERLLEHGRKVTGIDGSAHAIASAAPSVQPHLIFTDLRLGDPPAGKYDLVICTEVAEHLEAAYASKLVSTLVRLAKGPIYFTAAPPGQGGLDHQNEQPATYWLERFARHRFHLDISRSFEMRKKLAVLTGMHWFATSSMVLVPEGT